MTVLINTAPFQIIEGMTVQKVDLIFRMIKLSHAYVTRCGRLVGVVSRTSLMEFLVTISKYRRPGIGLVIRNTISKYLNKKRDAENQCLI